MFTTRLSQKVSFLLALLCLCGTVGFSQTKGQNPKVRLAQSYEQGGKFEDAVRIYEELLAAEPANVVFFDGVRRMYLQLKRYEELIVLLQNRIAASPNDVSLRAQLGSALYKSGHEQEATAEWEKAISVDPKSSAHYRVVAAVLMENRLLERTADLYRRARIACNDPNLFTMELAQLLASSMDYRGATSEFVRWLNKNPNQLSFIESRMTPMTSKEEGRRDAIAVVQEALEQDENLQLYELQAWLHVEGRQFEEAFEVYRRIDKLSNAGGASLLTFADRAFREKAYQVAASAYNEAIGVPVAGAKLPAAKYGYASCLKEMCVLSDTAAGRNGGPSDANTMTQYGKAIDSFNAIIAEYPRTEYSARAHFQVGLIQFERYFDLDAALQSFRSVETELPPNHFIVHSVSLKIGEVLVARSDTAGAAEEFRKVIGAENSTPDQQDEATFRLAELEFFRGAFKDAEQQLGELTLDLHADYANDALSLLAFLHENNPTAPSARGDFARAEYLARQRKYSEAVALFLDLINQNPKALLVDDALMKVGKLQAGSGQFLEAIASFERLLTEFTETSISLDRAQFNIGEIYQYDLKDKAEAIAAYEKLLARFPQSLHITEARKRIREMRGEGIN